MLARKRLGVELLFGFGERIGINVDRCIIGWHPEFERSWSTELRSAKDNWPIDGNSPLSARRHLFGS